MAGKLHKLSARTVAALTRPGRHSDGGGLYLFISHDSEVLRRRWVRFTWQSKTREMGLGPAKGVSLAEARKLAAAARNEVANGRDPIEARDAGRRPSQGRKTFGECATALIAAKQSEWRNAEHRRQWRVTLETLRANLGHACR